MRAVCSGSRVGRVAASLLAAAALVACGPTAAEPRADAGPGDDAGHDGGSTPTDQDGDGLSDTVEGADASPPTDTDGDGTPDYLDLDSDGDRVLDADEGARDYDLDGTPSFRDLDSDGDGFGDRQEAGDDLLETPPVECPAEVDSRWRQDRDGLPPDLAGDGLADFVDVDSDNDGLGDAEESGAATSRCAFDTDDDALGDLVESAFSRVNCDSDPSTCTCGNDAACGIPDTDFFVTLPYGGDPVVRRLELSTALRSLDVVLLIEASSSRMGAVRDALAAGFERLATTLAEEVPDARIAAAAYEDFPFAPFGEAGDTPLRVLERLAPATAAQAVGRAIGRLELRSASDVGAAHTEALARLLSGAGETWRSGPATHTVPAYASVCPPGQTGAVCFREGGLPLVVQLATTCAHAGPPSASTCPAYTGITPSPTAWATARAQLEEAGGRFVGVNVGDEACEPGVVDASPCAFLLETADATATRDLGQDPLYVDLLEPEGAADALADALVRVATRVPFDVDTVLRDDGSDLVDARTFIQARRPTCRWDRRFDPLPSPPCWEPPAGFPLDRSLAAVDDSTYFGVLPRSKVTFELTFANESTPPTGESRLAIAYIDLRANGRATVDTRQVYVLLPAGDPSTPR